MDASLPRRIRSGRRGAVHALSVSGVRIRPHSEAHAQQTPLFDSFKLAHQHANVRQMMGCPGEG